MVLGSIALLLGSGTEQAVFNALALLLAHAFYKAGMFMVAGSVDHGAAPGYRSAEQLAQSYAVDRWQRPLGRPMAGLPPFGGFAAKELMFKAGLENPVLLVVLVPHSPSSLSPLWWPLSPFTARARRVLDTP